MKAEGFHSKRLTPDQCNPREVVFADAWTKEDVVHLIIPKCTARDARVAATVIQWLGSNVGSSFLMECLADPEVFAAVRTNDPLIRQLESLQDSVARGIDRVMKEISLSPPEQKLLNEYREYAQDIHDRLDEDAPF